MLKNKTMCNINIKILNSKINKNIITIEKNGINYKNQHILFVRGELPIKIIKASKFNIS